MASFNKVILMGNLTRDPQLRYLPNNTAVCDFGLAVNRRYRDRDGNQKEEVCFVDLTAWARQAETINQYVTKGRPILVEGRLKLDSWTGQDGQKRSKLTVVVGKLPVCRQSGERRCCGRRIFRPVRCWATDRFRPSAWLGREYSSRARKYSILKS